MSYLSVHDSSSGIEVLFIFCYSLQLTSFLIFKPFSLSTFGVSDLHFRPKIYV